MNRFEVILNLMDPCGEDFIEWDGDLESDELIIKREKMSLEEEAAEADEYTEWVREMAQNYYNGI